MQLLLQLDEEVWIEFEPCGKLAVDLPNTVEELMEDWAYFLDVSFALTALPAREIGCERFPETPQRGSSLDRLKVSHIFTLLLVIAVWLAMTRSGGEEFLMTEVSRPIHKAMTK